MYGKTTRHRISILLATTFFVSAEALVGGAAKAQDATPAVPEAARNARAQANTTLSTINVEGTVVRRAPPRRQVRAPAAPPVVPVRAAPAIPANGVVGYLATRSTTATKTDTPLRDVPQAVTVVTKQQVEDIGAQKLEDVVRYVPGVVWHQGEGNRDQVVIRGQSSTADFFVNGMRDDGQVYRDLYNAERIEFLKGPSAMIFGRGNAGGLLNRILKEADGVPINEWKLQTGSYNNKRVSADIGHAITDTFAARINGVFEDSNSYRDFFKMQRSGINPTFTWTPTGVTTIKFSYEYFHDYRTADRGIPSQFGIPYPKAPPSAFFGNPLVSETRSTQNIVMASFQHIFDNGLMLKSQTRFADYKRFYQNAYPGSAVSAADTYTMSAYNNTNDRQNITNQTDWTKKFAVGFTKHTVLFGTEFSNQQSGNSRFSGIFTTNRSLTSPVVSALSPTSFLPVSYAGVNTDARNSTNLNVAAAYVQDQIELSRHFQVIGGVRVERFALDYTNLTPGYAPAGTSFVIPFGSTFSRTDNLTSPRVGGVFKPIEPLSIYASYSVSYLPASGDQFNGLTPGTAAAQPEKFVNKEFGVKWDITQRLQFSTAFYNLDRTNSRLPDPNNAGFFILSGATQTRGIEVSLAGYLTDQWQMTGGYAYTDARVVGATSTTITPGNRVALIPYNTFSMWNRYDFNETWGAGVGVIYSSNFFAGSDDTVLIPAYTRVDAALFWRINKTTKAQINVENVFGTKYYPNADGNNNITIGSPRAARFVLTTNFAGVDRPPTLAPLSALEMPRSRQY